MKKTEMVVRGHVWGSPQHDGVSQYASLDAPLPQGSIVTLLLHGEKGEVGGVEEEDLKNLWDIAEWLRETQPDSSIAAILAGDLERTASRFANILNPDEDDA